MKIAIVGTGYVGLVTGSCFAETGNDVICVDANIEKIKLLQSGQIPFYEPGLQELVQRNTSEHRLTFSAKLESALMDAVMVFISVGTPSASDGTADLSQVMTVAEQIAAVAPHGLIVVTKSTVPVGTGDQLRSVFEKAQRHDLSVVSNPEFLREGSAVQDCLMPDRVVIGTEQEDLRKVFEELYQPFLRTGKPLLCMDRRSAEMSKYASNALIASRISFVNEMARICEKVGANMQEVRRAMGTDHRIGMEYLFPSVGFGGSCFPKDVRALHALAQSVDVSPYLLNATLLGNEAQKANFVRRVVDHFGSKQACRNKNIAVWGLAFKAKTDDIRESPALTVVNELLNLGVKVTVFDPQAMTNVRQEYGQRLNYADNAYAALDGAHALCVLTEWNQFRYPNFDTVKALMKEAVIFDGRNLYNAKLLEGLDIRYIAVGQG